MAAYDVSINSELQNRGLKPNQIQYDATSQSYNVNGQPFMKADKVYNNTGFTTKQNFDNAYSKFNQPTTVAPHPTAISNTTITNQPQQRDPYALLDDIMKRMNEPSNYDPYSSAEYKAAEAAARRGQQQQTRAAQEAYGSAGFGRSTGLGERVAGIAGETQDYLMTQVVPQLVAQNEQRRQQELQNQYSALNALLNLDNTMFDRRVTEAELTGQYIRPEAQQIIDDLLALKSEAETPGLSESQYATYRQQGDVLRNRLLALGIDPSFIGSDVTSSQAQQGIPNAFQTLTARQLSADNQFRQQQQDLNNMQTMAQLTGYMPDGSPTSAQQQRELENAWFTIGQLGYVPENLSQLVGVPTGTRTQDAIQQAIQNQFQRQQLAISQQNANTSAMSAQTSRMNANQGQLMDIWRATGVAPEGIQGVAPGTPYYDPVAARQQPQSNSIPFDDLTKDIDNSRFISRGFNNEIIVSDPEALEMYILSIPNLTNDELVRLYRRYGLPLN